MNVTCRHCSAKLNIPDDKISNDRENIFKCPKCKERIVVPARERAPDPPLEIPGTAASRPFDERRNALVCIGNRDLQTAVFQIVKQMGFECEVAMDAKDALERMEYHIYHLILVDEAFEPEGRAGIFFQRMNSLDMSLRRKICLIMISNRFNSNDHMAALHGSVNNMIHQDDIPHLESFLTKALMTHQNLYKVYSDCLKEAGRI